VKACIPAYDIRTPEDLKETVDILERERGKYKIFAGGTDIMPLLQSDKLQDRQFLNIWNLQDLRGIRVADDKIVIGALTTHTEIKDHPVLKKEFPLLCQAASMIGARAIQNRGTIGGNIANSSPAADSCPPLLVYDAKIVLMSANGQRHIDYTRFHTGYKQIVLEPQELIFALELCRPAIQGYHYFKKIGARKAEAISKVCFAGVIEINEQEITNIRIALGSVAPMPLRCARTEAFLLNNKRSASLIKEAKEILSHEISPIDDIRSSRDYRITIASNLLAEFIDNAYSLFL
jgi:CO/xanthine dehydrogenase FAD-binding subunit